MEWGIGGKDRDVEVLSVGDVEGGKEREGGSGDGDG